MRRLVVLVALLAAVAGVRAQGLRYTGFSGGMMVHSGWIGGGDITLNRVGSVGGQMILQEVGGSYRAHLSGAPTGIGGAGRIHLGDHLRVGGEGYVSTLNYGGGRGKTRNQSHARIGWGGVLADVIWNEGRFSPFVGGTVGAGGFRNLTLVAPTPTDNLIESGASYRHYTFALVAPFAGVEYALTERVRLVAKADWMINLGRRQADFATGPRLYFGFMFYRGRE